MAHVAKYQAGALGNMCGHYERWNGDLSKATGRMNIDPQLTYLNYNLAPPRDSQINFINNRIKELNLPKAPRKDAVRMCDCVITTPKSLAESDRENFFKAAYKTLTGLYGEQNVISSWVHYDEPNAQPHMHFAWVPVTPDGRLSAKQVLNRNHLKTLHTTLQKSIEKELGKHVEVLIDDASKREKGVYLDFQEFRQLTTAQQQCRSEALEARKEALEARKEALEARRHEEVQKDRLRGLESDIEGLQGQVGQLTEEKNQLAEENAGLRCENEALKAESWRIREKVGELLAKLAQVTTWAEELAQALEKTSPFQTYRSVLANFKENPYIQKVIAAGEPWMSKRDGARAEKEHIKQRESARNSLSSLAQQARQASSQLSQKRGLPSFRDFDR